MDEPEKESKKEEGSGDYFAIEKPNEGDFLEEELYGDLSVDLNQEMTYPELKQKYDDSVKKIQEVIKENQALKEQNLILKKNISSLYLTARGEIQRKDAQIKVLLEKEVKKRQLYAQKMEQAAASKY